MTRFKGAGTLGPNDPYIERPADGTLLEALRDGEYCYVLAPRQSGKSSLVGRTRRRLVDRATAALDMSAIAYEGAKVQELYRSVTELLAEQVPAIPRAESTVARLWKDHRDSSPVHVFVGFLRTLMEAHEGRLVVFVDEIEALSQLGTSADHFFTSIRAVYNEGRSDPALGRLTFCLLGVFTRHHLNAHVDATPFNVGIEVRLDDFTREETHGFAPYLAPLCPEPVALLDAIHEWTEGQPRMTQRLLQLFQKAQRERPVPPEDYVGWVSRAVEKEFLQPARNDVHLGYAEDYLRQARDKGRAMAAVGLYRHILRQEAVPWDEGDPAGSILALSGLAAPRPPPFSGRPSFLEVRNRVTAEVYDEAWCLDLQRELLWGQRAERWAHGDRGEEHLLNAEELQDALTWLDSVEGQVVRARHAAPTLGFMLKSTRLAWARQGAQAEGERVELEARVREQADLRQRAERAHARAEDELTEALARTRSGDRLRRLVEVAALTLALALVGVGAAFMSLRADHRAMEAKAADQAALLDGVRAELGLAEGDPGAIRAKVVALKGAEVQVRSALGLAPQDRLQDGLDAYVAERKSAEEERDRIKGLYEKASASSRDLVEQNARYEDQVAKLTALFAEITAAAESTDRLDAVAQIRRDLPELRAARARLGLSPGAPITPALTALERERAVALGRVADLEPLLAAAQGRAGAAEARLAEAQAGAAQCRARLGGVLEVLGLSETTPDLPAAVRARLAPAPVQAPADGGVNRD